jgi:hypothetical protein
MSDEIGDLLAKLRAIEGSLFINSRAKVDLLRRGLILLLERAQREDEQSRESAKHKT